MMMMMMMMMMVTMTTMMAMVVQSSTMAHGAVVHFANAHSVPLNNTADKDVLMPLDGLGMPCGPVYVQHCLDTLRTFLRHAIARSHLLAACPPLQHQSVHDITDTLQVAPCAPRLNRMSSSSQ